MLQRRSHNNWIRFILLILSLTITPSVNGRDETISEGTDMDLEDLVNIKVTIASKNEEPISDAPGVISVITQDQLKRFGGTTLGDILKRVPSLLGTTTYMTDRSAIASRGDQVIPSSSHILLLIDGRPMREILEGGIKSEVYETFPVDVIERIEVIRGPGSVLYGSQAISAVINVITKSPGKNCTTVSGALGERLHNTIGVNFNYKLGDFGIVVAGRYADKGNWRTNWQAPNMAEGIDNVSVAIPDYGPGLFTELNYKEFRLISSYNQWYSQNFISDSQKYKGLPFFLVGDATGPVMWKKLFGDLGYKHKFSDQYSASLDATYTRSLFETSMYPWVSRDAFEAIIEQTNFFNPFENFNIVLGGVWGYMTGWEGDSRDETIKFNKNHKQKTFSGYLQLDYRWEWCKSIGGIQANKVGGFETDFNPRAGLIFYPLEHMNIKTLYSTAYRAPSLDELYLDQPAMRGQMVNRLPADGNQRKELRPEKVNTIDVGGNYQDDIVQFGLNYFSSTMKNLIIQDGDTTRYSISTWDNIGAVTIFGLECEAKYYITKEFLCEGSFLYQESKDENSLDENVSPLPNFSAKGGVSYQDHGLTISAFNTYWQALDRKYSSALNKSTGRFNMLQLNCSFTLNHPIKWTKLKELSFTITADNLLDVEVWLPAWGLLDPSSRIPYNQGRTIYCGIKATF
jgi:outer membrane receptor for ferrienterochelin and colicins